VERSPTLAGVNSRQRWTMVAAVLGSSIVFLDGTIVNVALPAIGQSLPHSIFSVLEGQTYVTSGYLATLAALLILAGALSDFYGRRRVFAIGLTGFLVTSIVCGLSPSLELLVVFRVLQGAAGALLVPCSLSIITATFDGPERGRAFGIWAAATSATTPSLPGTSGTPASPASTLARDLSFIRAMDSGGGPTKMRPASVHARAKSALSETKPYPGCTASAPVSRAAARRASVLR